MEFTDTTLLAVFVLIYFALVLWFGMKGTHRSTDAAAYLTANRSMGTVFCTLSLVSTIIGGSATLGIGSLAQKNGTAAFWWLGVGAAGLLIHAWLLVPRIRRMQAVTLPEVVGEIAGAPAERWSAFIIATSWVAITAAQFVALYALLGSLAGPVTGQILYWVTVAGILIHTVAGGQRGVIRTDVVQALVLLIGFICTFVWLLGTESARMSSVEWQFFTPAFGLEDWVKMMLLVGITYVIGPDMFSRTFSAKDTATARFAAVAAAPLLVLFSVIITLMAVMNLGAKQPVGDWLSAASPLPFILKAMLSLGLISALCGSADTVLLSAGGIFSRDILRRNDTRCVQRLVLLIGVVSALLVYVQGNIIKLLLSGYALFVPGVAVPLLVSLLFSDYRFNRLCWTAGAVAGGLCGIAAGFFMAPWLTYAGMAVSALGVVLSRALALRQSEAAGSL